MCGTYTTHIYSYLYKYPSVMNPYGKYKSTIYTIAKQVRAWKGPFAHVFQLAPSHSKGLHPFKSVLLYIYIYIV